MSQERNPSGVCKDCGKYIGKRASVCRQCGERQFQNQRQFQDHSMLIFVGAVVLAIVLLFSWLGSIETEPETFGQCFNSKVDALGEARAAAYCTRNAK